uniref:Fibronectin type-III domain-containing protein n=1 Tax=Lynx canadensis TaxID=61383 RepID=A0A667HPC1_LYNCA
QGTKGVPGMPTVSHHGGPALLEPPGSQFPRHLREYGPMDLQHLNSRFDAEAPKIRVPCHLRQTYIRQVGETVSLQIPFQVGVASPQASWTHSGHALDSQRVHVCTGDQDSVLGPELRLSLPPSLPLHTLVPQRNLGPPSSIRLLDVWGYDVALEWTLPQDPGNTELLGYVVQKADKMIGQWFTVLERYHPTTCTVSDLIVGNAYSFRVFSENLCGLSTLAAVTKEPAQIRKADIVAKPKGFVEQDFSEAPSFTQPLADHTSTPGYSTQLFCRVRALPKWLESTQAAPSKPIPAFLCSRRSPTPLISGLYTCKAISVLGEASVACRCPHPPL